VRFDRTTRFKRAYQALPVHLQIKVDKTLRLLAVNLRHPSLQVKKMKGRDDLYEARVDLRYRLTFLMEHDVFILRVVGDHDDVLKNP